MDDRLNQMLEMQALLQLAMPDPNKHPHLLQGDERAEFVRWNMFALEDELHEAAAEMGWKPWATSRHMNPEPMLKEMVDAWHFFMNILLVIQGELGLTNSQLMDKFYWLYYEKNAVNVRRQIENYDGVTTKCPNCYRELSEVDQLNIVSNSLGKFCSSYCATEYHEEGDHA